MDDTSIAQGDADYRRGTVLGLTVAEVFILLLFLLLLAFLVMVRDWETERVREKQEREQMNDQLVELREQQDKWQGVMQEFETPEEIRTLRQQKDEAERNADFLQEVLDQSDTATKQVAEQAKARREAETKLEETQRQLDLLRTKGENPPCWYEIVPDDKRGTREKPLYALNVAVFNDHMIVHRPEPPPGGAEDDGDSTYAEEAARLPFGDIPYGQPLTDAQIVRRLQPISAAGKAEKVRSYACIFWLRVWDKTSPDAKERWKQAHDGILEGMFGAYTVRQDPWPRQHALTNRRNVSLQPSSKAGGPSWIIARAIHQLVQHELQDAAALEVLDLVLRVEA